MSSQQNEFSNEVVRLNRPWLGCPIHDQWNKDMHALREHQKRDDIMAAQQANWSMLSMARAAMARRAGKQRARVLSAKKASNLADCLI